MCNRSADSLRQFVSHQSSTLDSSGLLVGLPQSRSCYSGCWADRDVAGGAARGWAHWGGKLFILGVSARDNDNDDDKAGAVLERPCLTLLCIGRNSKVRQDGARQ